MNADQYAENAHCSDLIARLEKAEAGSRLLDEEMLEAMFDDTSPNIVASIPPYTASLDAITALIGDMFGAAWRVQRIGMSNSETPPAWATVGATGAGEQAWANTPPLALCAALLRALQAKEGGGHG